MKTGYINIPIFILSLAFGLFFVYLSSPPTKAIFVYPTPENSESVQYIDKSDTCFKYTPKIVPCPKDESKIKSYDLQV